MALSICPDDKDYPSTLKLIQDPPERIFYRGNIHLLSDSTVVAVVGSRRCTYYGEKITRDFVVDMVGTGIVIASGFMYGIDAFAHKFSINSGGNTIAVLPCGIDQITPSYQKALYSEIIESGGLVISEYETSIPGKKWVYPKRNRIVAGISACVLVVEAALNSGSLITAEYAKRYEKRVFAVPGNLTSNVSAGTNRLIYDGNGICTLSSLQIIDYLKSLQFIARSASLSNKANEILSLTPTEQQVINFLKSEALNVEELLEKVKMSVIDVNKLITGLILKNLITERDTRYYVN